MRMLKLRKEIERKLPVALAAIVTEILHSPDCLYSLSINFSLSLHQFGALLCQLAMINIVVENFINAFYCIKLFIINLPTSTSSLADIECSIAQQHQEKANNLVIEYCWRHSAVVVFAFEFIFHTNTHGSLSAALKAQH